MAHHQMKIITRPDPGAGVVRAFWSNMDESQMREIATLGLGLAESVPGLLKRWKAMLGESMVELLKGGGCFDVTHWRERQGKP